MPPTLKKFNFELGFPYSSLRWWRMIKPVLPNEVHEIVPHYAHILPLFLRPLYRTLLHCSHCFTLVHHPSWEKKQIINIHRLGCRNVYVYLTSVRDIFWLESPRRSSSLHVVMNKNEIWQLYFAFCMPQMSKSVSVLNGNLHCTETCEWQPPTNQHCW